jgi:hypothetical protein
MVLLVPGLCLMTLYLLIGTRNLQGPKLIHPVQSSLLFWAKYFENRLIVDSSSYAFRASCLCLAEMVFGSLKLGHPSDVERANKYLNG